MDALIRESLFGRLLNLFTDNKSLPYPDYGRLRSAIPLNAATPKTAKAPQEAQYTLVEFLGPDDPAKPQNWTKLSKTFIMLDVMLLNFSFYAASAIFTPSIPDIEGQIGATTAEGTLGLSLFVIAYGIGPLFVSDPRSVSQSLLSPLD
jgi:DHA1 family multidrug resistance protein-like MFS transporter